MSGTDEEDLMADAWAAALEEQVTAEAKPAPLEDSRMMPPSVPRSGASWIPFWIFR